MFSVVPGVCTLTTASTTRIPSRNRISSPPGPMAGLRGVRVGRCTIRSEPAGLVPGPGPATAVAPCHRAEGCRTFLAPWPHRFAAWRSLVSSSRSFSLVPTRCLRTGLEQTRALCLLSRLHPLGRHQMSSPALRSKHQSGFRLQRPWLVLVKTRRIGCLERGFGRG